MDGTPLCGGSARSGFRASSRDFTLKRWPSDAVDRVKRLRDIEGWDNDEVLFEAISQACSTRSRPRVADLVNEVFDAPERFPSEKTDYQARFAPMITQPGKSRRSKAFSATQLNAAGNGPRSTRRRKQQAWQVGSSDGSTGESATRGISSY